MYSLFAVLLDPRIVHSLVLLSCVKARTGVEAISGTQSVQGRRCVDILAGGRKDVIREQERPRVEERESQGDYIIMSCSGESV